MLTQNEKTILYGITAGFVLLNFNQIYYSLFGQYILNKPSGGSYIGDNETVDFSSMVPKYYKQIGASSLYFQKLGITKWDNYQDVAKKLSYGFESKAYITPKDNLNYI